MTTNTAPLATALTITAAWTELSKWTIAGARLSAQPGMLFGGRMKNFALRTRLNTLIRTGFMEAHPVGCACELDDPYDEDDDI